MRKIKDMWEKSYGEGTKFDLDYGKLIISISLYLHCNKGNLMFTIYTKPNCNYCVKKRLT